MATNYRPAPGAQQPTKYNVPVGPNYQKYGEQPGYIYVPQFDKYYINPKSLEEQYKGQGLIEEPPKEPGLGQTLLPIAATVGTLAATQEGAKALPGLLGFGAKEGASGVAQSGIGQAAFGAADQAAIDSAVAGHLGTTPTATGAGAASAGGGAFSLGGIGSAGNAYLPALGALGAYDVLANDRGPVRGGLQGAASGAMMGSYFGPPGMIIGGAAGGLIGLGKGLLGGKSTGEIQADRWESVGRENPNPQGYDYFAGTGGEKSRDESFLTVDSIRNNPDNYNNIPDWDTWSREKQDAFLTAMLANKKVQERKGGIYYDDDFAKQTAGGLMGKI